MKSILVLLVIAGGLGAGLAGCRSLGYNDQSVNNSLTPNISQTEYTRTWQPTPGQPGQATPAVTKSSPPVSDTNSPSPAPTPPATPAH